eukprot:542049_1
MDSKNMKKTAFTIIAISASILVCQIVFFNNIYGKHNTITPYINNKIHSEKHKSMTPYINISNHNITYKSDEVLIASFHSRPKFNKRLHIFIENKKLYASIHSYDTMLQLPSHLSEESFNDPRKGYSNIRFKKLWMLDFLMNWNPSDHNIYTYNYNYCKHKYIIWIDGDALFTKLEMSIPSLWDLLVSISINDENDIENIDDIYIIFATNVSGINAGVLLIKCNEWTKLFIKYITTWNLFKKPNEFNDQGC